MLVYFRLTNQIFLVIIISWGQYMQNFLYDFKNPFTSNTQTKKMQHYSSSCQLQTNSAQDTIYNYNTCNNNKMSSLSSKNIINEDQIKMENILIERMRRDIQSLQSSSEVNYLNSLTDIREFNDSIKKVFLLSDSLQQNGNMSEKLRQLKQKNNTYGRKLQNPFEKQRTANIFDYDRKYQKQIDKIEKEQSSLYSSQIKIDYRILDPLSIKMERQYRNILHQQNFIQFKEMKKKQQILNQKKKIQQKQKQNERKMKRINLINKNSSNQYNPQESRSSESLLFNLSSSRRKLQSLFSFGMDTRGNNDLMQSSIGKQQIQLEDFAQIQGKNFKIPKQIVFRKRKYELIKFS